MDKHPLQIFRETQSPPWSQSRMAGVLGVSRVTVWRWERGDRFPERDLWPKIRDLTGLSIDDLGRAA